MSTTADEQRQHSRQQAWERYTEALMKARDAQSKLEDAMHTLRMTLPDDVDAMKVAMTRAYQARNRHQSLMSALHYEVSETLYRVGL